MARKAAKGHYEHSHSPTSVMRPSLSSTRRDPPPSPSYSDEGGGPYESSDGQGKYCNSMDKDIVAMGGAFVSTTGKLASPLRDQSASVITSIQSALTTVDEVRNRFLHPQAAEEERRKSRRQRVQAVARSRENPDLWGPTHSEEEDNGDGDASTDAEETAQTTAGGTARFTESSGGPRGSTTEDEYEAVGHHRRPWDRSQMQRRRDGVIHDIATTHDDIDKQSQYLHSANLRILSRKYSPSSEGASVAAPHNLHTPTRNLSSDAPPVTPRDSRSREDGQNNNSRSRTHSSSPSSRLAAAGQVVAVAAAASCSPETRQTLSDASESLGRMIENAAAVMTDLVANNNNGNNDNTGDRNWELLVPQCHGPQRYNQNSQRDESAPNKEKPIPSNKDETEETEETYLGSSGSPSGSSGALKKNLRGLVHDPCPCRSDSASLVAIGPKPVANQLQSIPSAPEQLTTQQNPVAASQKENQTRKLCQTGDGVLGILPMGISPLRPPAPGEDASGRGPGSMNVVPMEDKSYAGDSTAISAVDRRRQRHKQTKERAEHAAIADKPLKNDNAKPEPSLLQQAARAWTNLTGSREPSNDKLTRRSPLTPKNKPLREAGQTTIFRINRPAIDNANITKAVPTKKEGENSTANFPFTTLTLREHDMVEFERSISELTMRSSYYEGTARLTDTRRMAYYAVGKHHDIKKSNAGERGGNRRCYFTGRLILSGAPFYAGSVQQGLRTLVVFCLPSSIGLPKSETLGLDKQFSQTDRSAAFSTALTATITNKTHQRDSSGSDLSAPDKNRRKSLSRKPFSSELSNRDSFTNRTHSRVSRASRGTTTAGSSSLGDDTCLVSLLADESLDPNYGLKPSLLLRCLPEPDALVLDGMRDRFPEQFNTLPVQVRSPHCWRLFVKFCFFSGLPIAEGEMHYRVRNDLAMEVYGEEIVLSHEVMEAVNGEQSADILRLPNKKTFRYLRKHYKQQSGKLNEKVFQRTSWELIRPEF